MTGNFVMLQMDDLRQVVSEIVEEVCAKRGLNEKPSEEEGEWLTRAAHHLHDAMAKGERGSHQETQDGPTQPLFQERGDGHFLFCYRRW